MRERQNEFAFLEYFDTKISSYDSGILKANTDIFRALIEQSAVDASEIVYSDDRAFKWAGANKRDIDTIVFENINQCKLIVKSLGICFED